MDAIPCLLLQQATGCNCWSGERKRLGTLVPGKHNYWCMQPSCGVASMDTSLHETRKAGAAWDLPRWVQPTAAAVGTGWPMFMV